MGETPGLIHAKSKISASPHLVFRSLILFVMRAVFARCDRVQPAAKLGYTVKQQIWAAVQLNFKRSISSTAAQTKVNRKVTGKFPKYWAFRITEALPLPYWQTCILYGLLYFCVLFAALWFTGADFSEDVYIRGLLLMPFLAAYITALGPAVTQSANTMIERLEFCIKPGAPVDRFKTESYRLKTSTFWVWTLIFQAVSLASQFGGMERNTPSEWVIFFSRQFLFLHYTFYVFLYVKVLQESNFLDKWDDDSIHRTSDLNAVGRLGMSLAFLVGVALAIVGVVQIVFDAPLSVLLMVIIMSTPGYFLVFFTLFRPTTVVKEKIGEAKLRERRRIAESIDENRHLIVLGEHLGGLQLLAYRKQIVEIEEWPFDMTTIRAFAALFIFPIVSWIGAAFVPQLLRQLTF